MNDYEKYVGILEAISKQCDEKTYVEDIVMAVTREERKHYILKSGLHVYKGDGTIKVSKNPYKEQPKAGDRIEDLDFDSLRNKIVFLASTFDEQVGPYPDVFFEFAPSDRDCMIYWGSSSLDIPEYGRGEEFSFVLEETIRRNQSANPELINGLKSAQVFLDSVLQAANKIIIEKLFASNDGEQSKDESAEVQSDDNLSDLSEKELEALLQKTIQENMSKRNAIRKMELISAIKAAQQEGKELDAQIRDAKAKMARGE